MNKVCESAADAVADIPDGACLAVGGFGFTGVPSVLIRALLEQGATHLTVASNNCGNDGFGLGILLENHRIAKSIGSYMGYNEEYAHQYLTGQITVEFCPQGTLAERMRAAGAGIPAFYTPAGVGTPLAEGGIPTRYHSDGTIAEVSQPKEIREFGGRQYVLEEAIKADFALVHAACADVYGNLMFSKSARNFNPDAAMCGRTTIVQVEKLIDAIPPEHIHLPGIYVQRIVCVGPQHTRIGFKKTRD